MALTFGRWLALLAAGITMIPVLVFSVPERSPWTVSERARLHSAANGALRREQRAAERLHLLRLRDSVRAALLPSSAASRTVVDERFDVAQGAELLQFVRDARASLPASPRIPADVMVLLDSAQTERGVHRAGFSGAFSLDYLLPTPNAERCLVLVRVNTRMIARLRFELSSHAAREHFMGPCAFYATFGMPGPRIDEWLRGRGWTFAQASDWTGQMARWNPPSWFRGEREEYDLRTVVPAQGFACLAGSDASCAHAVLDPAPGRRPRVIEDDAVSTAEFSPIYGWSNFFSRTWPLGPREIAVLSDMVRTLGPERFARFWRSDLEPAAAFQNAASQSLGHWTQDWMQRVYFPQRSGAGLGFATITVGVLLLLAGAAIAAIAASRRRFV